MKGVYHESEAQTVDPNVNRSRIIPGSAATVDRVPHQLVQPKADPRTPYINTHLGLFHGCCAG